MKNFKKVLSLALAVVMVAATVLVAPVDAKAKTVTTYTRVTDVATIAAGGEFVMVVDYNGKYYALNNIDNTKKWGYTVELTAASTEFPTITVEAGSAADSVYLKLNGKYVKGANGNYLYDDDSKVDLTEFQVVENGTDTFQFKLIGSNEPRTLSFNNSSTLGLRTYKDSTITGNTSANYAYKFMLYAIGEEEAPSTIAEALATEEGTVSKVKGVVTFVDGKNIYIQDATGGIDAYFAEAPADIQLGDTIEVEGSRTTYKGLPELANATYTKSSGLELVAKEVTIGELTTADICTYVSLKGLTVTEVYDNNGAYTLPNITVTDGTNEIQLYKAIVEKVDGEWAIKVGDVLDVVAAVGVFNTTLQLRTNAASDITVVVVEDDNTGDDTEEVVAKGTYATANSWWGGGSYLVGYLADAGTVRDMEVSKMGAAPKDGFPWWTAVVMELQEDGNYLVTEVIPADGTNDKLDIALTTGRIVINYHSSAEDAASVAFWDSVKAGDVLSCDASWEAMAAVEAVGNFTLVEVEDDTTGDDTTGDDVTGDEGNTGNEDDTTDEEIKNTGDNFVPMFVVLFAGAALVAVAVVAKRRMA